MLIQEWELPLPLMVRHTPAPAMTSLSCHITICCITYHHSAKEGVFTNQWVHGWKARSLSATEKLTYSYLVPNTCTGRIARL